MSSPKWTTEQQEWVADVSRRADSRARSSHLWLTQLDELCVSLSDQSGVSNYKSRWMEVALFYLRAHGVVTELPAQYATGFHYRKENAAAIAGALKTQSFDSRSKLEAGLAAEDDLYLTACSIRDDLTDDELVVLWYFRNLNAHVFLESEGLKLTKSGAISDLREIADRRLTVAQIDEARNRLDLLHGREFDCARAIAIRIKDRVTHLRRVFGSLLVE